MFWRLIAFSVPGSSDCIDSVTPLFMPASDRIFCVR
jgi:hypothetical protein